MNPRCVRVHGLDALLAVEAPGWAAGAATATVPWTISIEAPCPTLELGPQPAVGKVDWWWDDDGDRTSLQIHGGAGPSSARFTIDRGTRRIDIAHTTDSVAGCLELLGRWVLPDLARDELGSVPIHATSVVTDAGAIAVVGESGRGKSSLTAALLAHGAWLLGDEPVSIVPSGSGTTVHAGVALLRLDAPTAERVGLDRSPNGPFVDVATDDDPTGKLALLDRRAIGSSAEQRELRAIVVLADRRPQGAPIELEPATPQQAFRELFEQRYARAFDARRVRSDFVRLAAVVNVTPVLRASLLDDLAALPSAAADLVGGLAG